MRYRRFLALEGPASIAATALAVGVVSVNAMQASSGAQDSSTRLAAPVDPISTVIEAFRTHEIVALGEARHGNEQGHAFRLSLIRDPRFAATVNDILVESGNALYQDVMDRFVRGETVSDVDLRQVWQNTVVATPIWDAPIYEEFFRAVRAVNASLPRERQLRVLLGDPPIDWSSIHSRSDFRAWNVSRDVIDRDTHPAGVIMREVVAKKRRALIVYGDGHLQRKNEVNNYDMSHPNSRTLVSIVEGGGTNVFTVCTPTEADLESLQDNVPSWPKPSMVILRGTSLGQKDFSFYYPAGRRITFQDGKGATPVPRDQWASLPMEDQCDALLYLGPRSSITTSRLSPALCADSRYMDMRVSRFDLTPAFPSGAQSPIDELKKFCATVRPQ